MTMRSRILVLGAILAATAVGVGCGSDGGSGGDDGGEYKLGAILSLSGAAADLGQHERDAIELAVDQINAAGGVDGREITVELVDDGTEPDRTVAAFNDLVRDDSVLAIFGGTLGTTTLAMSPLSAKQGVPLLSPNTTYDITRQGNDYLFRVAPPADAEIEATAELAREQGWERLALLHSTDAYASQAAGLFAESDLDLVGSESFDPEDTDMTAQLTKLNRANPDALLVWDLSPATGIAIRNAGQLGMTDIPILSGQGSNNPGNIDAAGNSPALDNWIVQGVVDEHDPLDRQTDGIELLEPGLDYSVDTFASLGYDGVRLFAAALEEAGDDPSRDSVRDALEQVSYDGLGGEYRYSPDDHDGVGPESIVWLEVRDGGLATAQLD
jgi:branched-chain amino acid transport system substrate-binding protein